MVSAATEQGVTAAGATALHTPAQAAPRPRPYMHHMVGRAWTDESPSMPAAKGKGRRRRKGGPVPLMQLTVFVL